MKNYYYNPKTQDLTIFDTESKEMLVLERLLGVRVLTTSDLDSPGGDEPVKKWKNHDRDADAGKAKRYYKTRKPKAEKPAKTRAARVLTCKKCGGEGHFAKTCKNTPVQSSPLPKELPDEEVTKIAREEQEATPLE
jgi:hypothetical protein